MTTGASLHCPSPVAPPPIAVWCCCCRRSKKKKQKKPDYLTGGRRKSKITAKWRRVFLGSVGWKLESLQLLLVSTASLAWELIWLLGESVVVMLLNS